jgi:uncharacterized protein
MTTRLSRRGMDGPLLVLSHHSVFTGYASLFNRRDATGDIIMPGAFSDSVKNRGAAGIRMLFQHDPAEPVGTWIDIAEDQRGLFVRGKLDANVQRGRELISLLQTKGVDGLSIGFKTLHATRDRTLDARRITKVDLWEISLVTFPMLEGARVSPVTTRARALAERVFLKSPPSPQQEFPNPWN